MQAGELEAFLASMTPHDQLRYKAFVSSTISNEVIADIVESMLPPMLDPSEAERVYTALSAAAKIHAVQLVEAALDVKSSIVPGDQGPLQPDHLVEAHRRLLLKGKIPGAAINATLPTSAAQPMNSAGSSGGAGLRSKKHRVQIAEQEAGSGVGAAAADDDVQALQDDGDVQVVGADNSAGSGEATDAGAAAPAEGAGAVSSTAGQAADATGATGAHAAQAATGCAGTSAIT